RQCREITLEGLGVGDVRDYLEGSCPGAESDQLAGAIHAHTDGTPLFVVAVVDSLIRRGWLIETDPGWAVSVPRSHLDLGVPDDVRDLILSQLRALPPRQQRLLEAASAAGVEFEPQAVAAGMRTSVDAAEASCEHLARSGRFLRVAGSSTWP